MIEVNATLFFLLLELGAALGLVLAVIAVLSWRRRARIRTALQRMVAVVNESSAERARALRALVAEGDADSAPADALSRAETALYRSLVDGLAARDPQAVASWQPQLSAIGDGYRELIAGARAASRPEPGESDPASAQLAREHAAKDVVIKKLKGEYTRVSEELKIARKTVEDMLQEYSSMFAGGAGNDFDRTELLEQLGVDADSAAAAVGGPQADAEVVLEAPETVPLAEPDSGAVATGPVPAAPEAGAGAPAPAARAASAADAEDASPPGEAVTEPATSADPGAEPVAVEDPPARAPRNGPAASPPATA